VRREVVTGLVQCCGLIVVGVVVTFAVGQGASRRFEAWGVAGAVWGIVVLSPVVVLGLHLVGHLHDRAAFTPPAHVGHPHSPDRPFGRLEELDMRLRSGPRRGNQYHFVILPVMYAAVEDRLWRHHGVDLAREPVRARLLLGEELWGLVSDQSAVEPPPTDRLSAAVRRIEEL
jgi:hypothetical protein